MNGKFLSLISGIIPTSRRSLLDVFPSNVLPATALAGYLCQANYPDKSRSGLQKYTTTSKGESLLVAVEPEVKKHEAKKETEGYYLE